MRNKTLLALLLAVFMLLLNVVNVDAQRHKKKKSAGRKKASTTTAKRKKGTADVLNIKAPTLKNKKAIKKPSETDLPETTDQDQDTEKPDPKATIGKTYKFDPLKPLTVVSEDTNTIDEGHTNVVEVAEEIKVDSSWIKIADYYSIWDTRFVRLGKLPFEGTVDITLYDSAQGRGYSMPQRQTQVNSRFKYRNGRPHCGVDLELDTGDSIRAAFDGIVRVHGYDTRGYGNYLLLRHYNGLETVYGHMSRVFVESGTLIKAGDLIGLGGSTGRSSGPHLHFETRYQFDPINPEDFYRFEDWDLISRFHTITPQSFQIGSNTIRKIYYHRIRPGDNLGEIAEQYDLSINTLIKLNGIKKNSLLKPGQRIRVK